MIPEEIKQTFTAELFRFSKVLTHEKSFKFHNFINKSPLADASKESNLQKAKSQIPLR